MAILGYWKLNGNSNDYSGNGYNGTDSAITYTNIYGVENIGASFNGTSSKINVGSLGTFSKDSIFTASVWVKPASVSGYHFFVQQALVNDASSFGWCIGQQDNKFRIALLKGIGGVSIVNTTLTFSIDTWHYVVGVFDTSYASIYVDGVYQTRVAYGTMSTSTPSSLPVYLGDYRRDSSDLYLFSGIMDLAEIDLVAWSVSKIKNSYTFCKGFF